MLLPYSRTNVLPRRHRVQRCPPLPDVLRIQVSTRRPFQDVDPAGSGSGSQGSGVKFVDTRAHSTFPVLNAISDQVPVPIGKLDHLPASQSKGVLVIDGMGAPDRQISSYPTGASCLTSPLCCFGYPSFSLPDPFYRQRASSSVAAAFLRMKVPPKNRKPAQALETQPGTHRVGHQPQGRPRSLDACEGRPRWRVPSLRRRPRQSADGRLAR